ncbi:hypothetical protein Tco_0139230 [Tanacetum coccineum]
MGKDGKPLKPIRKVQISEKEADNVNTQNPSSANGVESVVEPTKTMPSMKAPGHTSSFTSIVQQKPSKQVVKIKELRNSEKVAGAAVAIPLEAVEAVKFKFVKHSFMVHGGRSNVCTSLIEVSADVELMDELVIAIPAGKDKGHSLATIKIEYEWRPPRCSTCLIFDHDSEKCPKLPKEVQADPVANDGFEVVKKKKNRPKNKQHKQVDGVKLSKPALNLHYRRVEKGETSKKNVASSNNTNVGAASSSLKKVNVSISNSFTALTEDEDDIWGTKNTSSIVNDSDSEEIDDEIVMEERTDHPKGNENDNVTKGASTPDETVVNV